MNYCASSPKIESSSNLVLNVNTGIEYEIALFYCLLNKDQKSHLTNHVIDRHPFKTKIQNCISGIRISDLKVLNIHEIVDCCLTTQDDNVGPSDIVIHYSHRKIGLSVKYDNTCNVNISGKYFLNPYQIINLKRQLSTLKTDYLNEMSVKYGNHESWFRKRKRSEIVDGFIDLIRDAVIENWSVLTISQKREIIKMFLQLDSPIPYYIVKIGRISRGSFPIEFSGESMLNPDVSSITLEKHQTSYIEFKHQHERLGLLQVKFNNGFVEKSKGQTYDFMIGTEKVKFGAPFTSWNFTL